ncbi:E3 ubiquitin protein ligase RIN2-like [Malania oleifera]|uniref:E3 ubiquitin protein ligase RIN2-like n=1 Tax=Malania oleifera TaxID=397392 RepID=UPI0025ADEBB7|nr:E3 ubiquitin protein ligase RIN2-like [Malania oleifera]XP_057951874.1 E3 ubiquitin protein ligase RIN2-like [Malania oleifera]XP_057951875.1 E3 ubiquitin protein ligase RIN2-like [Malania oleifera]XP_057951876.1 E3 ubiquitin protein ligase RIN2-like [Malania oleifera]XP_057951877.1 E3 ubiquitin protein ligase RIN2-like [Malania oleifera]
MGVNCLPFWALFFSVVSFVGLQCFTELSLEKLKSDGLNGDYSIHSGNVAYATIAWLGNFVVSVFILLILCLKTMFFGELYASETRKAVELLLNYVISKGAFLPLVVPPTKFQAGLWLTWLTVMCSLKMFQSLAKDRLERLNASPSATPWTYFRVFSVLLLVLFVDLLWIRLCCVMYRTLGSSMFLLLFFEPFCILFETLQAIVVHGFQLLDVWLHHSAGNSANCQRSNFFDLSAAGSLWEWKSILIRNLGFCLDVATLLMALGHYIHIWWLLGMAFHLVDVVLFLNIRTLLSAIVKRVRGFIRLRMALGTLHGALPDATSEELQAYDDECAICREPMAKAKRLSCNHLFHLACLRSWLDQGLSEMYSCPTCRKPLFVGRPEAANPRAEVSSDEQLARQISSGLDQPNASGNTLPTGVFPDPSQNPLESGGWRGTGLDASWLHAWPSQGVDGAGPSTAVRSVGLGRVQMMMRHLASVGETYAQTALEDAAWNLWPMNPSQAATSGSSISTSAVRYPGGGTGLHMRTTSHSANDDIINILAMAETVREVLPHIPDELIFQDLQRTNSVTVTVNNLLQM